MPLTGPELAANVLRQMASTNLDVDKLLKADEGRDAVERITSAPEAEGDELKPIYDGYLAAVKAGEYGKKERLLRARTTAADFYSGKLDLDRLGEELNKNQYDKLYDLVYGLMLGRPGFGARGTSSVEQAIMAQQALQEMTGQQVEAGADPFKMRATSDMYEAERAQEKPFVEDDPRGYFVRKWVAMLNSESNAYPEMIRLRAWQDSPVYFRDVERAMLKLMPEMGAAIKAQKGPDLEHLPSNVPEQNNWLLFALREFCLPLVVEHEGNRESLKRLDILSVMDIMEESPELRALFFSNNKNIVSMGEERWAELICEKILGINPIEYKANPEKYKIFTLNTGGKKSTWDVTDADVTDEKLIPWNPFHDAPAQVVRTNGHGNVVYEKDYEKAGGVGNWYELFGGLKFAEVVGASFFKAYGRVGQYDPAILGEWNYPVRPALRPKTYRDLMYSMHVGEMRPWVGHWYMDFLSENAHRIEPMLINNGKVEVMGADLNTKSELELADMLGMARNELSGTQKDELIRRVVDLRSRIVDFIFMDKSVRPWFENYLDALANGEMAFVPKELLLIGFKDRHVNKPLKDSLASIADYGKAIESALSVKLHGSVTDSVDMNLDFSKADVALQFLLFNRTEKGWLRTKDQMLGVVDGLLQNSELAKRVFNGWDPGMAVGGTGRNTGLVGLRDVVAERTLRNMRLDLLPDYALWNWHYYLSSARKSADIQWQTLTGANLAGVPLIQTEQTIHPDGVGKQMVEAGEGFSGAVQQWSMLTGTQRGAFLIEKFYSVALNTIPAGMGRKRRVFKENRVSQSGFDGSALGDDGFKGLSDMYEHVKEDDNKRRNFLGIVPYEMVVDQNMSKKRVLVGPGGSIIFKGEYHICRDEKDAPMHEMYGGRAFTPAILSEVINAGIDAGGVTEHTMYRILGNFLFTMKDHLPKSVFTQLEKEIQMNIALGIIGGRH